MLSIKMTNHVNRVLKKNCLVLYTCNFFRKYYHRYKNYDKYFVMSNHNQKNNLYRVESKLKLHSSG